MIRIVHGYEVHAQRAIMEKLYRDRFENFVVRRGWSLPTKGGLDIDQYDNEDAVYFMVMDGDGDILASARIHRTPQASLLADLYPGLIETGEDPRGETLFEGTRYMVSAKLRSQHDIRRARVELNCTAVEWMMTQGGTEIQAVVDFNAFPSFVAMSTTARPLGLAHDYGGGKNAPGGGRCIAFRWKLTRALLYDFREYGDAAGSNVKAGRQLETIH